MYLATCLWLACGLVSERPFTPLVPLQANDTCSRCNGWLLPGTISERTDVPLRVDSDLPELFRGEGVLYATTAQLPPFAMKDGRPVPAEMRTQRSYGFDGLTHSFDVFLYHFVREPEDAPRPKRIVVYTRNRGAAAVRVTPLQMITAQGEFSAEDGPEAALGRAWLEDAWQPAQAAFELAPREGRATAWTMATSAFVNGMVRVQVSPLESAVTTTSLDAWVVAVDAATPEAQLTAACERLLSTGAQSQETMDLAIAPPTCHVRRVSGVSRNFVWRGGARLDVNRLPADGWSFLMAAPAVQVRDCPEARQTHGMLLHPPYVHPETVGNYLVNYEITLELVNTSSAPVELDLRFGKQDADIGLAWQVLSRDAQVHTAWAGKSKTHDLPDNTRSLLVEPAAATSAQEGRLRLEPKEERTVVLRLTPLPSSSLPFALKVVRRT